MEKYIQVVKIWISGLVRQQALETVSIASGFFSWHLIVFDDFIYDCSGFGLVT